MDRGGPKPPLPAPHLSSEKASALTVEQLCLSVLYEGEATGYDIRRHYSEGEAALFADASTGAIYPALAKLEAKELVCCVFEEQIGKPSRKVYRITDAGRKTFLAALQEPLSKDRYQSSFLHFLRFAHLAPEDIVETRIKVHQQHLDDEVARLETMLSQSSSGPQGRWTLEFALTMTRAMRDSTTRLVQKICLNQSGSKRPPASSR